MEDDVVRLMTPAQRKKMMEESAAYEKEQERQAIRKRGRTLYNDPNYRRQRAYLKATATHCHLCKQPFTDRSQITADHLIPGQVDSPLAPAHALCNSRRGNKPLQ